MMKLSIVLSLLISLNARYALACGDDHGHSHAKRAFPTGPITAPARPLVWGDLNVIHTTDSHGWLLGHQKTSEPEPNYSGDFGDFSSFVSHMKELAFIKGVDLLLVDSGDLHDGTGLSDGFPPGGVDAHDSNQFFKKLPYDILAIGNHELYIYNNTLDVHRDFAPALGGRYLSSNANITVPDPKTGNNVSVPVGSRYRKFRTTFGRKVTAFGVLYDFTGNDKGTTVQKVEDMVKEPWFLDAIKEEPDVFLLAGHMPVKKDKWPFVFNAIRAVHPTTPILIFGGHTHIRDCVQLDGRSMALESGRYMETVGWMSVDLDRKGSQKNLTFSRRYLDPNRVTYEFHTTRSNFTYDTFLGRTITAGLNSLAKKFDLSFKFGTAPHDYYLSRAPYPDENSLLSLFAQKAAPVALAINNTRSASHPNIIITNSGSQRFEVYSGSFTKNDQLTASPFADAFLYIADLPFGIAKQILPTLNGVGAAEKRDVEGLLTQANEEMKSYLYGKGDVANRYNSWLKDMAEAEGAVEKRAAQNLTVGYVTSDSCPGAGDDTVHSPLPFFSTPDFIASDTPANLTDSDPIDLVFVDFIETQLLGIVNSLAAKSDLTTKKNFTAADVQLYSPVLANAVLGLYAQAAWN